MKRIHHIVFGAALATAPLGIWTQAVPVLKLKPAAARLPDDFSAIISVRELTDGRVLIADAIENKVVVADFATGTAAQVGHNGAGPGEYQVPGQLIPIGNDSTIMVEPRAGRWHLFHGAKLASTMPPDHPAVVLMQRFATGADGRGYAIRHVAFAADERAAPSTVAPESSWVMRVHRGTAKADTLGRVKNAKRVINTTTNARGEVTMMTMLTPPFAIGDETALFEDGWLAIVRSEPYRVDWRSPDGRVTRGPVLPWPKVKITERDVTEYYRARARASATVDAARAAETLRGQVELAMKMIPDVLPPIATQGPTVQGGPNVRQPGLIVLGDGRLLIRHPETPDHPTARYDVVDRRGVQVGAIALGKAEWITAVSRKWAYIVSMDDDGLQYLSRHPWP